MESIPFDMRHVCVRFTCHAGQEPARLALLDRYVVIQTSLGLEGVLKPPAMALPTIIVGHEAQVPRKATSTDEIQVNVG